MKEMREMIIKNDKYVSKLKIYINMFYGKGKKPIPNTTILQDIVLGVFRHTETNNLTVLISKEKYDTGDYINITEQICNENGKKYEKVLASLKRAMIIYKRKIKHRKIACKLMKNKLFD